MSDATWYATIDGSEQGPLTVAELKRLVAGGRVAPLTPVRREGMTAAVPASRIKGLLPVTTASTEVLPAIRPRAPVQLRPDPGMAGTASITVEPSTAASRSRTATVATERTARSAHQDPESDPNPYAQPHSDIAPATSDLVHGTPAGFWIRTAAYLIDCIPMILVVAVIGLLSMDSQLLDNDLMGHVIGSLVVATYFFITEGAFGATLGKMACGLRVVDRDGRRIGFARSFKRSGARCGLGIIPLVGPLLGLIDVLMVVRESKLAWHDALSGTYVVRKGGTRPARRGPTTTRRTRRAA